MIRFLPFIFFIFLTSCGTQRLTVQSEYMLPDRYASVWVGTPDPHKYYPSIGQRLIIQWKLRTELQQYEKVTLRIRVRFRNYELYEKWMQIRCRVGRMIYNVMDEDYTCTDGIAAYHVQIFADGQQIAEIRHHLWEELIQIEDEDEDFEDIDLTPGGEIPDEFQYEPQFEEGEGFYKV
ncbi:MAG: hypothetical protein K940chlam3_00702 [Chlamydiae bacterium]|nr:hypothetical protein [Chlamydiota bacterium]